MQFSKLALAGMLMALTAVAVPIEGAEDMVDPRNVEMARDYPADFPSWPQSGSMSYSHKSLPTNMPMPTDKGGKGPPHPANVPRGYKKPRPTGHDSEFPMPTYTHKAKPHKTQEPQPTSTAY
ncbi:unnamed protein product [Discula destructiva]